MYKYHLNLIYDLKLLYHFLFYCAQVLIAQRDGQVGMGGLVKLGLLVTAICSALFTLQTVSLAIAFTKDIHFKINAN